MSFFWIYVFALRDCSLWWWLVNNSNSYTTFVYSSNIIIFNYFYDFSKHKYGNAILKMKPNGKNNNLTKIMLFLMNFNKIKIFWISYVNITIYFNVFYKISYHSCSIYLNFLNIYKHLLSSNIKIHKIFYFIDV